MSRLVFMVEEPSAKVLLETMLPRLFPDLHFLCVAHQGKTDLELSLPRKLRAWQHPGDKFLVVRDSDGKDCRELKRRLVEICEDSGRPDTLVRIACHELEAWYLGDPDAMGRALDGVEAKQISTRAKYRDPDDIPRPSKEVARLCPTFQKMDGARRMGAHLSAGTNRSRSFRAFLVGIERMASALR